MIRHLFFVVLLAGAYQVSVPTMAAAQTQALAGGGDECEFCADQGCQQGYVYWSPVWFPGSEEVSFLGEQGCIYAWGATCSSLIRCFDTEAAASHERVRELHGLGDEASMVLEIAAAPEAYALLPERGLLVLLNGQCAVDPVPGVLKVSETFADHAAGVVKGELPQTGERRSANDD
jgi:hypothetical protein